MKLVFKLCISAVMVASVMGCSDGRSRSQASDGFKYLDTDPLKPWHALPEQKTEFTGVYQIPSREFQGAIGPDVDIRPPQQVFELIPGMRYQRTPETITVWMPGKGDSQRLSRAIENLVSEGALITRKMEDKGVETDWVKWSFEDDKPRIETRHYLNAIQDKTRYGFRLEMLGYKENGIEMAQPLPARLTKRYNALMSNMITTRYDVGLREEARVRAQEQINNISVSLGRDRSALPVIIARASYETFWARLPDILTFMGFSIEDRNHSQGLLTLTYTAKDEDFWREMGVTPLSFKRSKYNIQLGDLGNRTSLNVTEKDGKPVSEEALDIFSQALKASIYRLSQKQITEDKLNKNKTSETENQTSLSK